MQCFYILIHGRLRWSNDAAKSDTEIGQPAGFFCHRYVLATDQDTAKRSAYKKVSSNLDRQMGWLCNGEAKLELQAEEVSEAPFLKAFMPTNRGHSFYRNE